MEALARPAVAIPGTGPGTTEGNNSWMSTPDRFPLCSSGFDIRVYSGFGCLFSGLALEREEFLGEGLGQGAGIFGDGKCLGVSHCRSAFGTIAFYELIAEAISLGR